MPKLSKLSPRQSQIMALVAKGLTNQEIAARFGTATDTVRQQRLDALHKVNARNSAHAVALLGIAA